MSDDEEVPGPDADDQPDDLTAVDDPAEKPAAVGGTGPTPPRPARGSRADRTRRARSTKADATPGPTAAEDDKAPVATKTSRGRPSSGRPSGGRPPARRGGRRRRRFTVAHAVVLVTFGLLVAGIVTLALDDDKASGWDWTLLALAGGAFVGSVLVLADQRGRLRPYRRRGLAALALVLGLAVLSLTIVVSTTSTPELGLDLQGGFSVVLSPQGDPPGDSIDQAMEIIRQRIDGLGVAEPDVTRQGDNVVVEIPGVDDREKAQEIVGRTAKLEFRPVLLAGLPYDAQAAQAGDDPCAAAADALAAPPATTAPGDTSTTAPGDTSSTTAPGDTSTTAPGDTSSTTAPGDTSTTAPGDASTTTAAPATSGEEQGAAPAPIAGGVVDGDNAAAVIPGRQDDSSTTSAPAPDPEAATSSTAGPDAGTTAPATTAPVDDSTTAPVDGATTTTTTTTTTAPTTADDPAREAAAEGSVTYPTTGSDGQPPSCTQLGPVGFEGGALSKSSAQLGGATGAEWVVSVTIRQGQREAANTLFNLCFNGEATRCPALGPEGRGLLAIALDGEVVSSPQVNSLNLADEDFQITGEFEEAEAKDLALVLRYGALPVEFTRSAERQVSPTLGEESLRAGILAGLIGLAAVALYLIAYYRALGVVVVLGLAVWGALMYGVICWLSSSRGLTLSLSGVVGIVVSVGTTVDSYVVHFERLKDEVRLGKSVRSSTEKGFQKAFRTILTADLAALMGAALLWWLTVGAVRGFAFFLGISVVLDLFVAYCFDRPVVALLARNRFFTEHRIFGVARGLGRRTDGPMPGAARVRAGASS